MISRLNHPLISLLLLLSGDRCTKRADYEGFIEVES